MTSLRIAIAAPTATADSRANGTAPLTFEVDGFRFGCAICIEVNFPTLFAEYEALGVDCMLLSAYPVDAIFRTKARAHAAINATWVSLSVPAQVAHLVRPGLIGPDGEDLTVAQDGADLVVADLDRPRRNCTRL
jgi:predicted amidohydrolase